VSGFESIESRKNAAKETENSSSGEGFFARRFLVARTAARASGDAREGSARASPRRRHGASPRSNPRGASASLGGASRVRDDLATRPD
jgi:hypothetical protein